MSHNEYKPHLYSELIDIFEEPHRKIFESEQIDQEEEVFEL